MPWDLKPLKLTLRRKASAAMAAGTATTVAALKARAPKQSGELAGSIGFDLGNQGVDRPTAHITTGSVHGQYVYFGTGIYGPAGSPIVPVNSQFLEFDYKGAHIITTNVLGQRPQKDWWDSGIDTWKAAVGAAYSASRVV